MTKTIGMIVPSVDNSFFANLAFNVEKELASKGYDTLICSSENKAEREKEYFKKLITLDTGGCICISGLTALPEDLIPADYPLVWVDRIPESVRSVPWVANDDEEAMEQATLYLIEKGNRNILLMPGYSAETQESPRVKGYKKALLKAGIDINEDYILKRYGQKSSETETAELVSTVMHNGLKVDGIITSSDRAAFGAMVALSKVGYYVPEDVKLISFDNSPYTTMSSPSITAIDRNSHELAVKAVEILTALIIGQKAEIENTIKVSLVKRDSTR